MRRSHDGTCDAVRQFAGRFSLSALALAALLLWSGCDRSVEPDLPETAQSVDGVVAEVETAADEPATVPNEPSSEPESLAPPPTALGIGDANPGLKIAKWVKGSPVSEPLKDKVHVVEFWATWCGPCRVGMPHISQLQSEYGEEVAFIGITREEEATVARFLEKESPNGRTWDEVIQYRLAIDDREWSNTAYMRAAGQRGIPCAFVVGRDGVVEWIGHPASIDEPLRQIVDGNWDRDTAIAEFKQQQRINELTMELRGLARLGDWDAALQLVDQLEDEMGKSTSLTSLRLNLLDRAGRSEEASTVRAQLIDDAWDDADTLNELAWRTATSGDSTDLQLALKAAERASELRDDQDASILDTVARCQYELGKLDEAIRWQRLAAEHNQGNKRIDATLKRYLKEKSEAEEPADEESKTRDKKPEAEETKQ